MPTGPRAGVPVLPTLPPCLLGLSWKAQEDPTLVLAGVLPHQQATLRRRQPAPATYSPETSASAIARLPRLGQAKVRWRARTCSARSPLQPVQGHRERQPPRAPWSTVYRKGYLVTRPSATGGKLAKAFLRLFTAIGQKMCTSSIQIYDACEGCPWRCAMCNLWQPRLWPGPILSLFWGSDHGLRCTLKAW